MTFETPPLPYAYDALEPCIDEQTMRTHHDKHHTAYTKNFNAAIQEYPDLQTMTAEDIIKHLNTKVPESIRTAVRNNGGGHLNHALFWNLLRTPQDNNIPTGKIASVIDESFGSYDEFKKLFSQAAMTRFGSGWAWLVLNNSKLEVVSTANQDSPLTEGKTPLLTLDVWEHAYYLKYQNLRASYVEEFWKIINWDYVNKLYEQGD